VKLFLKAVGDSPTQCNDAFMRVAQAFRDGPDAVRDALRNSNPGCTQSRTQVRLTAFLADGTPRRSVVQGSRAKGTAQPESDIDIAIRVSPERFDQIIEEAFGTPNPGSALERTKLRAIESGLMQRGEIGLRREGEIGITVQISVVREGGLFDVGPLIPLGANPQ